jgi:carboxyl-terminal processing protease
MQKTFDLPDGGAIILSIAKYASPSGKQFEDDAVTPGTVVASNKELFEDDDSGDDTAATAVTPVTPDSPTPPGNTPGKKTPPPTDDQLNKALDMLKTKAA